MENNIIGQINFHFGQEGQIIICKKNEYYKKKQLKLEEILIIKDNLETNPKLQNLENRLCYLSCCIYLVAKYDEKYKAEFCKQIIKNLSLIQNPINDAYLSLIYNCIDFEENFLHSDKARLEFLFKYLQKFSPYKKTIENFLLFKYYHALLLFRLGNIDEALAISYGIITAIEDSKDDKTQFIEFIKLKNDLLQIKLNYSNNDQSKLKENYALLRSVFEKVVKENSFLALKIGLMIYENLYNQNLYQDCIQILYQMNQIIHNCEKQGVNPKRLLRFSLSVFCRYGFIGLLLSKKQYVDFAINEMSNGLKLLRNDLSNKKFLSIFIGYTFSLTLLKMNSNKYVEEIKEISNRFMKEFVLNKFIEGKYCSDSFLITKHIINHCIINLNAINKNLDISMNEQAQKLIDYYTQNISVPTKNYISHNITFSFIVGLHDRIRYISENYLTDNNTNNQEKYKNQILVYAEHFWNYIELFADREPLLKTDFFKSIIIKIFSCCAHIYYYNKDDNNISKIINDFENLSNKLYINENTPSYELVWKVKGDYYFKKNDYNTAISFYNSSTNKMNDNNPKKPVLYFNLGVLYYYIGNKNASIENLQKAAVYFKKIEEEKSTFDFHKRNGNLTKKYNLTQYYIKEIQNN